MGISAVLTLVPGRRGRKVGAAAVYVLEVFLLGVLVGGGSMFWFFLQGSILSGQTLAGMSFSHGVRGQYSLDLFCVFGSPGSPHIKDLCIDTSFAEQIVILACMHIYREQYLHTNRL